MRTGRLFGHVVLALVVIAAGMACKTSSDPNANAGGQAVKYERIGSGEYQNFPKNWDEKKQEVLYALLQTPVQYDTLFHPAATMGDKRPFAPKAELYTTEQILVVARVMAASENVDKAFEVERIIEKDQVLAVHYRFVDPKTGATSSVKNCLVVRIPKQDYKKVIFIENGKQVGELSPAEGQWSVPALTPETK